MRELNKEREVLWTEQPGQRERVTEVLEESETIQCSIKIVLYCDEAEMERPRDTQWVMGFQIATQSRETVSEEAEGDKTVPFKCVAGGTQ